MFFGPQLPSSTPKHVGHRGSPWVTGGHRGSPGVTGGHRGRLAAVLPQRPGDRRGSEARQHVAVHAATADAAGRGQLLLTPTPGRPGRPGETGDAQKKKCLGKCELLERFEMVMTQGDFLLVVEVQNVLHLKKHVSTLVTGNKNIII